jgi:hypothetical protein
MQKEEMQYHQDEAIQMAMGLAKELTYFADKRLRDHPMMYISQADWESFVGTVEDAVGDLLHEGLKDLRFSGILPRQKFNQSSDVLDFIKDILRPMTEKEKNYILTGEKKDE